MSDSTQFSSDLSEAGNSSDECHVWKDEQLIDLNDRIMDHTESEIPPCELTKVIEAKKTKISNQKKKKSPGVVYLSRVPPYMRVNKVRHLLSQFGEVGRIYLQREDPMIHRRRKRQGGKKKTRFVEGWVELKDKKIAKQIAESLNNTPVGGKKRNFHYFDMWTVKYLHGFKWFHLTESIAYQGAVREQRLRTEISQVKRENQFYMQNVEKGKEIDAIQNRKVRQNKELDHGPVRDHFQRRIQEDGDKDGECDVSNVSFLAKILPNSIS